MSSRRGTLALLVVAGLVSVGAGVYLASQSGGVGLYRDAPGFELKTLEGETVSLASLRGKVVYVHLWATWCAPCRVEMPALERMYEDLRDEGFELLAATIDDPKDEAKIQAFREEFGLSFPILRDPERLVYSQYGATAVPETYLIDAEGRLAEAYIGPRDWDEPRYARTIRRLLEEAERRQGSGE